MIKKKVIIMFVVVIIAGLTVVGLNLFEKTIKPNTERNATFISPETRGPISPIKSSELTQTPNKPEDIYNPDGTRIDGKEQSFDELTPATKPEDIYNPDGTLIDQKEQSSDEVNRPTKPEDIYNLDGTRIDGKD